MEQITQMIKNSIIVFQNAFITLWYWCTTYKWELVFLFLMAIAVCYEVKEMKVHFVDDKRKVI